MRTQHNFCTQQIVILFGLNLFAGSRGNSFQEVLKAVLFGVGVYPVWGWSISPTAHVLALLWEPY